MNKGGVPKFLQPFLWSADVTSLNRRKDKIYIINQILAFGNRKALTWLFATYSPHDIKDVFLRVPLKIYRPSALNFAKEILLNVKRSLRKEQYVPTL